MTHNWEKAWEQERVGTVWSHNAGVDGASLWNYGFDEKNSNRASLHDVCSTWQV